MDYYCTKCPVQLTTFLLNIGFSKFSLLHKVFITGICITTKQASNSLFFFFPPEAIAGANAAVEGIWLESPNSPTSQKNFL